jgi:hypothetical protein
LNPASGEGMGKQVNFLNMAFCPVIRSSFTSENSEPGDRMRGFKNIKKFKRKKIP